MSVSTFTYTRTHTATYVADHMRNQLKRIIQAAGLSPEALVDDWDIVGGAIRGWLETGDLEQVTLEFFKPGANALEMRWDFDVTYGGSGVDDDMWVDRDHLQRTISKAGYPPANCLYRVVLRTRPGRPNMPGMSTTTLRSTDGFASRSAGTSIATPDVVAGLRYSEAGMSKVSDAFSTFKSRLEITQTEQDDASRRQKQVRATVQESFAVGYDFLTGSYARHTKTKPLKDIDIFVVLGEDERHRRKAHPKGLLDDLQACLRDAYGEDRIERDRRCVTVWFEKRNQSQHEDGKILSLDVVPAFEAGKDYEIPDDQLGQWIKTNPATHAALTTAKNSTLAGGWVPLVKMLKSWNRANGKPIKPSILIEVMALDLVGGPFTSYPDEARRFFAAAAGSIDDAWPDPAGLGPSVSDEMTTPLRDAARQKLRGAEALAARAFRSEQLGSENEAARLWREVFGEFFPAS